MLSFTTGVGTVWGGEHAQADVRQLIKEGNPLTRQAPISWHLTPLAANLPPPPLLQKVSRNLMPRLPRPLLSLPHSALRPARCGMAT